MADDSPTRDENSRGEAPRSRPAADRDRKPYAKRDGDRKPYPKRDGDKPYGDRKPYERRDGDKPYAKRDGDKPYVKRDGDRKPYPKRDGDKPYVKRDGDRKPYPKHDGDRKPYERRDGDKPYVKRDGDRKPYERRDGDKPYVKRDGDRKPYPKRDGDRKPYERRDGDKPYVKRDGDRKPYPKRDGDKPYVKRDGDRKPYAKRDGDRKPYERRDGDRPYAKRDGDKRQHAPRAGAERAPRDPLKEALRPVRAHHDDPFLPDEITDKDLHPAARNELKTLTKDNAEWVARHLAMVARLIDEDPELAHRHALSASRRAGRIAIVRETLAITAYATGDFALALRELRTYRRISGKDDQIALMVDSERGVGRPDRALEVGRSVDRAALPTPVRVELAIAMSGARLDLGDAQRALTELDIPELDPDRAFEWSPPLFAARASVLEELGRDEEAAEWRTRAIVAAEALDRAAGVGEDETIVLDEIIEIEDEVEHEDDDLDQIDDEDDDLDVIDEDEAPLVGEHVEPAPATTEVVEASESDLPDAAEDEASTADSV
jgi:hypothetical protein